MARIYLVRHGKAKGEWGAERDPSLDLVGCEQAKAVARSLASLGPLKIISSPYARTLETALPLAEIWNVTPSVDERIGEIPSSVEDLADRLQWFRKVMTLTWLDLGGNLKAWRRGVIGALHEFEEDTVFFPTLLQLMWLWEKQQGTTVLSVSGLRMAPSPPLM
jgi:phosphohistidine phosphatase SixA